MKLFHHRTSFAILLSLSFLLVFSGMAVADNIGTVRYVEVIAAHPRILKFDFAVSRFQDGPSAQIPLERLQERSRELQARLQEINNRSSESVAALEKSLVASTKSKKESEKEFWAKKEQLDRELEAVRDEIAANISAMEFGGRTIETLILPEVNQIMADVATAISSASKARGCSMVLSVPAPLPYEENIDSWIEEGYSAHLRQGSSSDSGYMKRWIAAAGRIVPRLGDQVNLLHPVLTGSVDITADAIKLLTQPARKGGVSRK